MPIILPQPDLDRDAFDSICNRLSLEDAEKIAAAYPALFIGAFVFDGAPAAPEVTTRPGPAKAREPKAPPIIDKASLDASVLACVAESPGQRSATIAAFLYNPARHGDDDKRFGDLVRSSLTRLVSAGKVYQDGTRKNARFKAAVKVEPEEGAAE